jgi:hypothetical protein
MIKPPPDIIQKSIDIRCRARKNLPITRKEHDWNMKVYNKYPEWYERTEPHIFNQTVPFGSSVYKEEEEGLL